MTQRFQIGDRVVTAQGYVGTVVSAGRHMVFGYSYLIEVSRFGYTKANECDMSSYDDIAEHMMEKM
jgi:hypothetical protein